MTDSEWQKAEEEERRKSIERCKALNIEPSPGFKRSLLEPNSPNDPLVNPENDKNFLLLANAALNQGEEAFRRKYNELYPAKKS